ncbi:MAG TPA: response regulator [Chloroflexia bacterium]|nr:response regulator [Chloroflexia bacterium]
MKSSHVLVIDDDPTWTALLAERLRPHYTVACANGGADGLAQCSRTPPDAVVLDLQMAPLDGRRVLAGLRATAAGRHIPVVIFSSTTPTAQLGRDLAALAGDGPLVLVPKSARFSALLNALREVLKPREA